MNLNWNATGNRAQQLSADGERVIQVFDGTIGYTADLTADMTVQAALRAFACNYDANDPATVTAEWELWENGEYIDGGDYSFEVTP